MKPYLIVIHGDVEPEVVGPLRDDDERDRMALALHSEYGQDTGIFPANVDGGKLSVGFYPSNFFERATVEGKGEVSDAVVS